MIMITNVTTPVGMNNMQVTNFIAFSTSCGYDKSICDCLSTVLLTLNAWESTLRHNCGLHIAHVHKNPCRDHQYNESTAACLGGDAKVA